jgi:hypothetical protein
MAGGARIPEAKGIDDLCHVAIPQRQTSSRTPGKPRRNGM